jgi:hypothetical protein
MWVLIKVAYSFRSIFHKLWFLRLGHLFFIFYFLLHSPDQPWNLKPLVQSPSAGITVCATKLSGIHIFYQEPQVTMVPMAPGCCYGKHPIRVKGHVKDHRSICYQVNLWSMAIYFYIQHHHAFILFFYFLWSFISTCEVALTFSALCFASDTLHKILPPHTHNLILFVSFLIAAISSDGKQL